MTPQKLEEIGARLHVLLLHARWQDVESIVRIHRPMRELLTSFALEDDREQGSASGFDGCVTIPVTPASLRRQIQAPLAGGSKD